MFRIETDRHTVRQAVGKQVGQQVGKARLDAMP